MAGVDSVVKCNFTEADFASFPESVVITLFHLFGLELGHMGVVALSHILMPALLDHFLLMLPELLSFEDTPIVANTLCCTPVRLFERRHVHNYYLINLSASALGF